MNASLRLNNRLPGVVVQTALPPEPAPLRLDVAGFVGFAERGPLDTPVAIEDIGQYQAVFGGDLLVAREGGRPVYAALPSAVRAFFDNGGRRCYAVRVAGTTARRARFALPGMAAISGDTIQAALLEAAWVGRWSDQLALWTQLLVRPLALVPELTPPSDSGSTRTFVLDLPSAGEVAPGDLLRLSFDGGLQAYLPVEQTTPLRRISSVGLGVPVAVHGRSGAMWLFRRTLDSVPAVARVERLSESIEVLAGAGEGTLAVRAGGYDLSLPASADVRVGDLLRVTGSGGEVLLFPVARLGTLRASCDDPHWLEAAVAPASQPKQIERLRFALRVRQGETFGERFEMLHMGDWTNQLCGWADQSAAGPPDLPANRSALLRLPPAGSTPQYLPIGMALLPAADAVRGPFAFGDDGLASFNPWDLFLDTRLRDVGVGTLMPEAERLLYLSDQPTRLRALHSLLPVEELALVAIPDLAQRGWPAVTLPPPIDPPPPAPPAPEPPDWSSFQHCARPAPPAISADDVVRTFYANLLPMTAGDRSPGLDASARALFSERLRAESAAIALPALLGVDQAATSFRADLPPCATEGESNTSVLGVLTLASSVELRTDFTLVRVDDSWRIDAIRSRLAPTVPSEAQRRLAQLPLLRPSSEFEAEDFVRVQAALIKLCAARADMTAALSLPDFFERREAADWRERLETAVGLPTEIPLSYAAAYHPWLAQPELATPELAPLRSIPPDGAVCGMVAAREHERGVWIAPAGIALRGVIGLSPLLDDAEAGELFDAPTQINLVRQQPGRYVALSAHTLSGERQRWQLHVRRLLILLRKAALRRGAQYVFETNNERFRRQVRGSFERMLARLAQQGALAAFQVVADESLNTANDRDNGRFLVALKVAPISPIEFITVTLLRSGENVLDVVER